MYIGILMVSVLCSNSSNGSVDEPSTIGEDSTIADDDDDSRPGAVFRRLHDEVSAALYPRGSVCVCGGGGGLTLVCTNTHTNAPVMTPLCCCCMVVMTTVQARNLRERLKEKRQQILAEAGETFAPAISERSRQMASGQRVSMHDVRHVVHPCRHTRYTHSL